MAHLFITELNEWTTRALSGEVFQLPGATPSSPAGALVRRAVSATPDGGWHLLAPPSSSVHVNGEPAALGIRVLRDKDEIRLLGAAPMFFSTEQLVAVEPFAGLPEGRCPRCTKAIEPQSPAVRCGVCNTWYHQADARRCFTYGENPICVMCGSDAVLSGEFAWSPEEL